MMRQPSIRSVKVRESPCASALLFCRSRGHETLIIQSCPSSAPSAKSAVHPLRLRSAIPENCLFLAKFSERSFRMTNDKFSMRNFQFRRSPLVAALPRCALAPLRSLLQAAGRSQSPCPTPVLPYRTRSHPIAASQSDFILPGSRPNLCKALKTQDLPMKSRPTNPSTCRKVKIAKRTQFGSCFHPARPPVTSFHASC